MSERGGAGQDRPLFSTERLPSPAYYLQRKEWKLDDEVVWVLATADAAKKVGRQIARAVATNSDTYRMPRSGRRRAQRACDQRMSTRFVFARPLYGAQPTCGSRYVSVRVS